MSVKCNISPELAKAVGCIAATHPDCGIQIEWRESDPMEVWHVLAIDGSNPAEYIVYDEAGDISDENGTLLAYGIDLKVQGLSG